MRYRRHREGHFIIDFGGRPLLPVLARVARLSWETAPGIPGMPEAPAAPDVAAFVKLERGGIVRALTMFRAGGRRCETYLYRQGENWLFHGTLFAQRANGPWRAADRDLIVDPERFLARLAGELAIDDAVGGDRDVP